MTHTALIGKNSILTGQHDHPMLRVPAGVQRNGVQGQVGVRDPLPGRVTVIAISVDHHCPALCHSHTYQHKPVLGAGLD